MGKRRPPKNTQRIQVRAVPTHLWKQVHRAALKRHQSIQEFVIEALQNSITLDEPLVAALALAREK